MTGVTHRPLVQRAVSQAGDPAWLITDYALVRTLLNEPRLVSTHPEPEKAARVSASVILGGPLPESPTEDVDHVRMRRALGRRYSTVALEAMRPRLQALVDELLDRVAASPQPADFHEAVSYPLPALVICELFGVPAADRDRFRRWSEDAGGMFDAERSFRGLMDLTGYLVGLVQDRLDEPRDDVVSDLAEAHRADPTGFTLESAAQLCAGLMFAGHETTVTAIDAGVVMLATNPDQRERLLAEPDLLPAAVEEILRVSVPRPTPAKPAPEEQSPGLPRWAKVDLDIDGVTVRQGELVLLGLQQANQDPALVGERTGFVVDRAPNAHLTFGHGKHYCVGASLARLELHLLFRALIERFPGMRLAVPVDELPAREDAVAGGLTALPVTW
ncbi:MAG: cytochrome P450 [Umezawaea sp.]